MGTTRSFLLLKNRWSGREELEPILRTRADRAREEALDGQRSLIQALGANGMPKQMLDLFSGFNFLSRIELAFRADAKWLPYFETGLCEGHIVSSRELKKLSLHFQTPVLGFAIFDSDILFLSYCDGAKQIFHDYAKPNAPWVEEYDRELYQSGLPAFLLSMDREDNVQPLEEVRRLKEIWERENMVFADDRMHELLELLGLQVLYGEEDRLDGFELIRN